MADFADLLEMQTPSLRRYAYAMTRDGDMADDLVQDCLERAWSRRFLRRTDSDLRPWLFAILRNLYIDGLRARRRRGPSVPIDEENDVGVAATQDSGMGLRDVFTALAELPEDQRSLVLLIGVEDLSYADAARVLGLPIGTVMSRLSRARERLRSMCEGARPIVLRRVK